MTSSSLLEASSDLATPAALSGAESKAARIHAALERLAHPARVNVPVIAAGILSWVAYAAVTVYVPDHPDLPLNDAASVAKATTAAAIGGLAVAAFWAVVWGLTAARGRVGAWATARVSHAAAWVLGSGIWMLFWELSTAKTLLFEPPYLVSPREILERLWDHRVILLESLGNSLLLLAVGFVVGLLAGLITGVVIGWWQVANYWVHPILVFIGPVPTLAWVPIVFVLFPSTYSGAVFMIALSVWFPISVLTRAGILGVPRTYFDVAQTLGAKSWFLVFRVSLPAALPSIFTGAFMALGSAFVSLTVAENFGVNSGLGWYLNWQKGWGDFPAVYAGIIVLVGVCGLALSLLFRIRNWVLRWEKELTRW